MLNKSTNILRNSFKSHWITQILTIWIFVDSFFVAPLEILGKSFIEIGASISSWNLSFFKCLNSGTCAFYDSSSRSPSFSVRRRRPIRPKLSKRRMQLKSPRKEMDTKAQQFHSVKIWSFFSYLEFLRETDFRF